MKEILGVVQAVIRVHKRLPGGELVTHGRQRGHLGDQAKRRHLAVMFVGDIQGVMVEGGEGADHAAHDRHGVGVAAKAVEECADLFVHHGMAVHRADKAILLLLVRQLAIQQQVTGLQVVGVLRQLLYRVTPVQQHALVAVDKGDLRFAGRRRHKTGIIREHALAGEGADVYHVRPEGTRINRQLDRCVKSVDGEEGFFIAHGRSWGAKQWALHYRVSRVFVN